MPPTYSLVKLTSTLDNIRQGFNLIAFGTGISRHLGSVLGQFLTGLVVLTLQGQLGLRSNLPSGQ